MSKIARAFGLAALSLTALPCVAARNVSEQRAADAHGSVQVNAVSGTIEVIGWDSAQVAVSGTLPNDGDSIEVGGDPSHITIGVHVQSGSKVLSMSSDGPRLTIHVPRTSAITTTLVSADFRTSGVSGDLELHSVSGDAKGEVAGNLRVSTVSGDVRLAAPAARNLSVKTVSGDIELSGGDGEVEVSTVSGTAHIALGAPSRLHFKSTSGDVHVNLGMATGTQVEGEAVSGDVSLTFREAPLADFDVQTHSGEIDNCFGPKPAEPAHGPGQRLAFRSGESAARVRVTTHSGDVEMCTGKAGLH